MSLDSTWTRLRRANEGGGFLFLINASSWRKKGKWIIESTLRLSGTQRKCELMVSENYAFGCTTPPGKSERKTSERNRDTEKGHRSLELAHSQATLAVNRSSILSAPVPAHPPLLLVKDIKSSSVPLWGVETLTFAWTDRTLRLEYPWMAVPEEPKYHSAAAILIENLLPLDNSSCHKIASPK